MLDSLRSTSLSFVLLPAFAACFSGSAPARKGPVEPAATGSNSPLGTTECVARCEQHADSCNQADIAACDQLCAARVSRAAIRCVEALACSAERSAADDCVRANPETAAPTQGVFGDACQCPDGAAECADVCTGSLLCVKQDEVSSCMGPVCCEGETCADRLGAAADCGQGRVCGCSDGASRCDRGICVVDH